MRKGYLKTYIKVFFIILVICAIIMGVIYYIQNKYKEEQIETIKTDMLLIQVKTKLVAEKVRIKEKGASYVGVEIKKESDLPTVVELQEKGIIDLNAKKVKYYMLEQSHLNELGLSNITLENGVYFVEYTSNEIIYSNGVEDQNGNRLYKLSEFIKVEE